MKKLLFIFSILLLTSCSKHIYNYTIIVDYKDGTKKSWDLERQGYLKPNLKLKGNTLKFGGVVLDHNVTGFSLVNYEKSTWKRVRY